MSMLHSQDSSKLDRLGIFIFDERTQIGSDLTSCRIKDMEASIVDIIYVLIYALLFDNEYFGSGLENLI